ncbi:Transposase, MuDR, plant [Gossypium australe]|uniref:Transposase, MuDR, plant n=1 Tax=Gossypium australe TaxID=47621 RepID=A0A5B6WSD0_9ROSI|nr:Transposase, MuDR, plant [Gossypium australe]
MACELENDVWEDVEVQESMVKVHEENGYEIDYFESDDHGSIVESSFEAKHEHGARRRKKNSVYNPNHENPKLYLGMLFRDGETFKDVSRRELKIVTNEPKQIRVKCITFVKCPWRISATYNKRSKCLQVSSFHKEHNCCVSFKNKMVNFAIIANHFEETIRDHPKMKLKEIQQRVASDLHVNVNLTKCRRAKKKSEQEVGWELQGRICYVMGLCR